MNIQIEDGLFGRYSDYISYYKADVLRVMGYFIPSCVESAMSEYFKLLEKSPFMEHAMDIAA